MHRIRAITLDLDDTLWEIGPVIRRAEADLWHWLERHYPKIPEKFSAVESAKLRDQIVEKHPDKAHDFRTIRKMTLLKMAVAVDYQPDFIDEAFAVFDTARNNVELFPGVVSVLQELSVHFKIIAVTNGNANLETIGIRRYFHGVVTAVNTGVAKPARSIFQKAVHLSGAEAEQVLHVGDHPELDVVGAIDAGLKAAWMNPNGFEWPDHLPAPDATIASATELRDLLRAAMDRIDQQP